MVPADPASLDLDALFRDPRMFDSRWAWGSAGFQLVGRGGKIMVALHPSAPGLVFKKYDDSVARKAQIENYERRVAGSRHLRAFVDKKRLIHVVVPRKWIVDLPRPFSRKGRAHVLVVEKLDLLGEDQTRDAYARIDPDVLGDLCQVLHHFRGMDSNAKNLPFTVDGKIALVDTEHWDRGSHKSYLHHLGDHLSVDRRKLAKKIFRGLDGDHDRDDFDDEEDTSSSSSSSS